MLKKELRECWVPVLALVLPATLGWSLADWDDVFLEPYEGPTLALFFLGGPLVALGGWWQHRLEHARGLVPYLAHRRGGARALFRAKCVVGLVATLCLAWLPLCGAYALVSLRTPFGPLLQGMRLYEFLWTGFGLTLAYAAGVLVAELRRAFALELALALLAGLGAFLWASVLPPPALQTEPWTMPLWAAVQLLAALLVLRIAQGMFERAADRETTPPAFAHAALPVMALACWVLPLALLLGHAWDAGSAQLVRSYPEIVHDRLEQRFSAVESRYPQPFVEVDEWRRPVRQIGTEEARQRFEWRCRLRSPALEAAEARSSFVLGPWPGFSQSTEILDGGTRRVILDSKRGMLSVCRLWPIPGRSIASSDLRESVRVERRELAVPAELQLSGRAQIVSTGESGRWLVHDADRAQLLSIDLDDEERPRIGRLELPDGDALDHLEGYLVTRNTPAGQQRTRVPLVVGSRGSYLFEDGRLVAHIPDELARSGTLEGLLGFQSRLAPTGLFAWRFEASERGTGAPLFSYTAGPTTPGERRGALALGLVGVLRPPLRLLLDVAGVPPSLRSTRQRRALFGDLLGPSLPAGWQWLHLGVAAAAGMLCGWSVARRGARGPALLAWSAAGFLGGAIALPLLWLVMPPRAGLANAPREPVRAARDADGAALAAGAP